MIRAHPRCRWRAMPPSQLAPVLREVWALCPPAIAHLRFGPPARAVAARNGLWILDRRAGFASDRRVLGALNLPVQLTALAGAGAAPRVAIHQYLLNLGEVVADVVAPVPGILFLKLVVELFVL